MYPKLEINKDRVRENVAAVVELCRSKGIEVAGVIKGCNGNLDISEIMLHEGVAQLGSSRISQLKAVKKLDRQIKTLLLRIPMLSELEDMVRYCDVSLQSEIEVILRTEEVCLSLGLGHEIILMYDVGDLREGFIHLEDLIEVAKIVKEKCTHVKIVGIGTNIGCYGSVKATPENMEQLVSASGKLEEVIGKKLEIVSGGATSSLPLVVNDQMPSGINHLRIGEGILTAREVSEFYGAPIKGQNTKAMILKAEIVEIKEKPTHPIGTLAYDAFGNKPTYEDRGVKTRMLVAVGRQDIGSHDKLIPLDSNLQIIGSSSDHLIVEPIDLPLTYKLGDVVSFEIMYPSMLYLTESPDVEKTLVGEGLKV